MSDCADCGDRAHPQCDLCHPHCYFRCSDGGVAYTRHFVSPLFGPSTQVLNVCAAHASTLGGRHDERYERWPHLDP